MAQRLVPGLLLVSLWTLGACTEQTISLGPGHGPREAPPPPVSTPGQPSPLPTPLTGGTDATVGHPLTSGAPVLYCKPGSSKACYDGPSGTELVGACSAGIKTCNASGESYGHCEGQVRPIAETCGAQVDDNCDGIADCTGDLLWSASFGDGETQESLGVAVDDTGNILLTGSFDGAFELGQNHLSSKGGDVFLVKLDPGGTAIFSKRFGDNTAQVPAGVAADTHDNVILAGSFTGVMDLGSGPLASTVGKDVFLAKYDPTGGLIFAKRFGDSFDQQCRAIATDRADDIALTGTMYGTIDFGGGPLADMGHDVFVAKLGPAGEHLFSKRFGDESLQDGLGVTFDSQGNVLVSGRYAGSLDFGGGPLPAGTTSIRAFVAKLDAADGHHLWSAGFGDGGATAAATAVAVDSHGDVLVTGWFSGTIDFGGGPLVSAGGADIFLLKLDGMTGQHRQSSRFGDDVDQQGLSLVIDGADNAILAGTFYGALDFGLGALKSPGGSNGFLLKIDPAGKPVWNRRFGDHKSARALSTAVANTGEVLVTGSFEGDADFGGGALMSAGMSDGFVAKYRP
ncbi:MAG: nucleotide-binding protein [Byssovorax sp.]